MFLPEQTRNIIFKTTGNVTRLGSSISRLTDRLTESCFWNSLLDLISIQPTLPVNTNNTFTRANYSTDFWEDGRKAINLIAPFPGRPLPSCFAAQNRGARGAPTQPQSVFKLLTGKKKNSPTWSFNSVVEKTPLHLVRVHRWDNQVVKKPSCDWLSLQLTNLLLLFRGVNYSILNTKSHR